MKGFRFFFQIFLNFPVIFASFLKILSKNGKNVWGKAKTRVMAAGGDAAGLIS